MITKIIVFLVSLYHNLFGPEIVLDEQPREYKFK